MTRDDEKTARLVSIYLFLEETAAALAPGLLDTGWCKHTPTPRHRGTCTAAQLDAEMVFQGSRMLEYKWRDAVACPGDAL